MRRNHHDASIAPRNEKNESMYKQIFFNLSIFFFTFYPSSSSSHANIFWKSGPTMHARRNLLPETNKQLPSHQNKTLIHPSTFFIQKSYIHKYVGMLFIHINN